MLRSAKQMEGCSVGAIDGVIGHIEDFYFDDEQWVIRYLVVETGGWLSSRKVLVSPIAFGKLDWVQKILPVQISREQVRKSPHIDTEKPVSRQHEMEYSDYYAYPIYWGGGGYWGGGMYPSLMMPSYGEPGEVFADSRDERRKMERSESNQSSQGDPHLRSCNVVIGYHIHASDGEIGHVSGLLIDEQTWAVRYLIADTSNWWLGHQILIAPQWIKAVNWDDNSVTVSMTRHAIKNAPAYKPGSVPDRETEDRLYAHHERIKYWSDKPAAED